MVAAEIKQLPDLLADHLEPGTNVLKITSEELPPAGAGSVMVKSEITIKTNTGAEEKVHVISKLVPDGDFAKEVFQTQFTYKKEVEFYKTIVPTLQNFRKQQGASKELTSFAKYYGSRYNLDNTDIVNDDAALVFEDLVASGYQNLPRRQDGFDLEASKLILQDLAKFQGTVIALKLKQPEVFKENIKPTCIDFEFPSSLSWITDFVKAILKKNPDYAHLAETISPWPCAVPEAREPYASIIHNDLWVNNTMQKIVNGKMVDNKFVDFQTYSYHSCANDVFFFLWTSCQLEVLKVHLDYLLKYYHDNLIATITELQCDSSEFSFDKFLEELRIETVYEFGHAAVFSMLVKSETPIQKMDKEMLTPEKILQGVSPKLMEHFNFMFSECHKRGWLH